MVSLGGIRFPGAGGGGGGLHFRDPVDVFATATLRSTYFTTTAATAYQQFAADRSLAIVIGTIANPTDFQTYTGSGTTYDDSDWLSRADAIQGFDGSDGTDGAVGDQGEQGFIVLRQFQNAATKPAVGGAASFVISTGVFTPSTGWVAVENLTIPATGEDTWFQEAEVDPATEANDIVVPTFSVVLEAGGTGPAGPTGPAGADGSGGAATIVDEQLGNAAVSSLIYLLTISQNNRPVEMNPGALVWFNGPQWSLASGQPQIRITLSDGTSVTGDVLDRDGGALDLTDLFSGHWYLVAYYDPDFHIVASSDPAFTGGTQSYNLGGSASRTGGAVRFNAIAGFPTSFPVNSPTFLSVDWRTAVPDGANLTFQVGVSGTVFAVYYQDGETEVIVNALVANTRHVFMGMEDRIYLIAPAPESPGGTAGADGADGADGTDGADGADGAVGPTGPVGPGTAGTPTSLSRFEAVTTVNTAAQALSAAYADILEIATTDIFANVGGFTVTTVANISTITIPNSGLFKITAHIKIVATGNVRSQIQLRANVLRSGAVVPNSGTIMGGAYVRATGVFSGVISGTTTLLLGTDDTVTFQLLEEGDTTNTYTIGGDDSVVEIIELPSEIVGVEGPAGADGNDGADGAGAAPAQDEGVTIVATPTAYNFVGPGVFLTNVGGVATVTIAGGGGPAPTHTDQYLAGKATNTFVAADFTGTQGVAYAANSHTATLPTVTGNVFIGVARLASDPAPTFADVNSQGINSFTDFTQQAGTITINADTYDVYVSNYALFQTGDRVEFR